MNRRRYEMLVQRQEYLFTTIELPLIKSHKDKLINLLEIIDLFIINTNADKCVNTFEKYLFSCYNDIYSTFIRHVINPCSLDINSFSFIFSINFNFIFIFIFSYIFVFNIIYFSRHN